MHIYLGGPSVKKILVSHVARAHFVSSTAAAIFFSRGTMGKGRGRRASGSRGPSSKDAMQMPENVLQDDVDAFHASRDKILLDEEEDQDLSLIHI